MRPNTSPSTASSPSTTLEASDVTSSAIVSPTVSASAMLNVALPSGSEPVGVHCTRKGVSTSARGGGNKREVVQEETKEGHARC